MPTYSEGWESVKANGMKLIAVCHYDCGQLCKVSFFECSCQTGTIIFLTEVSLFHSLWNDMVYSKFEQFTCGYSASHTYSASSFLFLIIQHNDDGPQFRPIRLWENSLKKTVSIKFQSNEGYLRDAVISRWVNTSMPMYKTLTNATTSTTRT